MPEINKMSPSRPATKSNSSSVLDRIQAVNTLTTGVKLNVYGRGKTGKTRLACTFPKPLLLIGTEDGTKSVSNVQQVDYVRLLLSSEVETLVKMITQQQKYKSVVLDTAGGLQDMIVKEVLGLDELPVQKSWGMAQQRDWGIIGQQLKERLSQLLVMADRHGVHVVVIAHERNFTAETESDVMLPSIGASLTPTSAAWLNGACDYVCQAFIREGEELQTSVMGQGKMAKEVTLRKKTDKKEYCLRVGPHPIFMTGFRLPIGTILPDVIVDPNYDKITALINGKSIT